jgi:uncharacterized protein
MQAMIWFVHRRYSPCALGRRWNASVCGLLLACLMPTVGAAASFDCDKARTALEKTVCADSKLSAEDAEMGRRHDEARSMLSDEGKAIMRYGQEQWLKVIKVLCLDHKRKEGQTECLRRQYKDRIDGLQTAAVWIGPFLFSRIDSYASSGLDGATGTPLEQHIALPRIDRPRSLEVDRWNATMVRISHAAQANWCYGEFASGDPKDPDTFSEQMLAFKVFALANFINVKFTHYEQCGAGAATENVNNVSFSLRPTLRPLSATDVFLKESHWASFITAIAAQKFGFDDTDLGRRDGFLDGIRKVVTDPTTWSFTDQGLVISFNAGYGDASIASGPIDVAIPWKTLYPYLSPTAPVLRH